MSTRIRAARLLILHDEGAVPHDWLCEEYWRLRSLSDGISATQADLRRLAVLERIYAIELSALQ